MVFQQKQTESRTGCIITELTCKKNRIPDGMHYYRIDMQKKQNPIKDEIIIELTYKKTEQIPDGMTLL